MGGGRAGLRLLAVLAWACVGVEGHGRLIEPPGRSTAWRFGFDTPRNYNDHEIYCGGYATQWQRNGGKCGPCGDPWQLPQPRDNEGGGKYGRGVIVKRYKHSSVIVIGVQITANHNGFFEFHICPHNNPLRPVSEECLQQHILKKADGSGTRYFPGPGHKKFFVKYRLPAKMTCKQCVLQWRYVAGNNWGNCDNGTSMVGCGPQEEFRSCADIAITEEDGSADDTPSFVPDYDEEDYNEVDVESHQGKPTLVPEEEVNHVGHVVALTLAFLLIIVVLLGLIIYFYWAKDAFKGLMKRQTGLWTKTAPPPSKPSSSVVTISGPLGAPPPVPPRRHRSASGESGVASRPRDITSISAPTRVTINGVSVNTGNSVVSHAPLHVPDD